MPKHKRKTRAPVHMVAMGDIHAGHKYGLRPRYTLCETEVVQRQMTDWYYKTMRDVQSRGAVDILVVNGDCVEGPGKKQTIAHATTDVEEQIKWAGDLIAPWEAKKIYMTRGTPYHVTTCIEAENILAENLDAEIHNCVRLSVCGKVFDFRHHTGKTSIPYGQGTLIAKRAMWVLLKRALEGRQLADVVVRSHVHEYCVVDTPMGIAMTLPALQIGDEVYGRSFESWYHVGLLEFWITEASIAYEKHILKLTAESQEDIVYGK